MRRAVGSTLRKAALGGWAVLALTALPAATGTALAADGHGHGRGHGATDGPARPHQHPGAGQEGSRGDEPDGGGDRGSDGAWTPVAAPVAEPVPAPQPEPVPAAEPRIDIGTALGPISGTGAPAATTRAPEAGVSHLGARRVPVLSLDAPSAFAPRSLAGRLRDAPQGTLVQVAIRRGSAARGCGWWNARTGRFGAPRRGGCADVRWITAVARPAAGGLRWRAALRGTLPAGTHRYIVRVLGADGRPVLFVRI